MHLFWHLPCSRPHFLQLINLIKGLKCMANLFSILKKKWIAISVAGREINFFPDSHLAPKFFTVVANSKKSWSPFLKTNKTFFPAVSVLDRSSKIKSGKKCFTCHKVDTRMDDIIYKVQVLLNPRWRLAINWDTCAAFWKQT